LYLYSNYVTIGTVQKHYKNKKYFSSFLVFYFFLVFSSPFLTFLPASMASHINPKPSLIHTFLSLTHIFFAQCLSLPLDLLRTTITTIGETCLLFPSSHMTHNCRRPQGSHVQAIGQFLFLFTLSLSLRFSSFSCGIWLGFHQNP